MYEDKIVPVLMASVLALVAIVGTGLVSITLWPTSPWPSLGVAVIVFLATGVAHIWSRKEPALAFRRASGQTSDDSVA
jgi:hypothetical protein